MNSVESLHKCLKDQNFKNLTVFPGTTQIFVKDGRIVVELCDYVASIQCKRTNLHLLAIPIEQVEIALARDFD